VEIPEDIFGYGMHFSRSGLKYLKFLTTSIDSKWILQVNLKPILCHLVISPLNLKLSPPFNDNLNINFY
jgi:hypothetical protein